MSVHADKTLYLHAEEQKIFERLPEELTKGWKVEKEDISSYETEEELQVRRQLLAHKNPQLQKILRKLGTATGIDTMDDLMRLLGPLPVSLLQSILFTIGATTLRRAIVDGLWRVKTESDLDGIALSSQCRHALLETNAEPVSL